MEEAPKVFVSYSRDSEAHANRVLELADRLIGDGVEVILDQYFPVPDEGWPLWTEKKLETAEFVLLVCTEVYRRRLWREEAPGQGLEEAWEGNLIRNLLRANLSQAARFIPILLDDTPEEYIPALVQGHARYRLRAFDLPDSGYEALLRHLTRQPAVVRPERGPRRQLSSRPRVPGPGRLWTVPYARNPFFTGREGVLTALARALRSDRTAGLTQAITGLGGVGKSQTALEYAYRHQEEYRAVFWVRAESEATLDADYARIARLLDLPEQAEKEAEVVREAVKRWLAEEEGYLLILDNADTPEAVRPFLPPAPRGHLLITSHVPQLVRLNVACPIRLDALPPQKAIQFLFRRVRRKAAADPAERQAAAELAVELGYLPLALEQAAAFIQAAGSRFADYLAEYRALRLEQLEKHGPEAGDHPETVRTTWAKSFAAVRAQSEAAAALLTASAFLAPEAIPEELLIAGAPELGEPLAGALTEASPQALDDLLLPLRQYSLVERNPAARTYEVHRLVQDVARAELAEVERRTWAERVVRAVTRAFPDPEFANWPACERLLPHVLVGARWIEAYGFVSEAEARLLNQAGFYLKQRARYFQAEQLYKQALPIYEQVLGPKHRDTAQSLNNLAELYHTRGEYAQAQLLHEQALSIREQVLGPAHPETAQSLNNLAGVYYDQRKLAQAVPLMERALIINEQVYGSEHPDVATNLHNLAGLYQAQGRLAQAESLLKRALSIREQALGPAHPVTANSLNNLASLYQKQGKLVEAVLLLERVLLILEPDHPNTAIVLNNLAILYQDQGKLAEAEPLLERALAIVEKTFGPEHPNTITFRENLRRVQQRRREAGSG
jgi:tetratricopeptide (TPR) repeat protein